MLTRQLRLAAGAHKTLLVPGLVPIGHPTFSQGLRMRQRSRLEPHRSPCESVPEVIILMGEFLLQFFDRLTDLFTARAARSKLVLVAGHAVVFILVRDEGLGANWLLTAVTNEAALVPCGPCILQLPRTW